MYGLLGSIYLLCLTEAGAQRRRLTQAYPHAHRAADRTAAGMSLVMFFRLAAVLGVGFGAIAMLAMMVG